MSIQAAHFILGQASAASGDAPIDEAVYTFTGALNGAGREFSFGLFGVAQGSEDAGPVMRATARHLLREIYLPLLPWDATDRPNTLDTLATLMQTRQATLTGMAMAVVLDNRVYMGWQGDGRAYLLTEDDARHFADADAEPVASQVLSPGTSLLLCTGGLWQNVADDQILHTVQQASSIQEACDRLVDQATSRNGASRPLVLMIHHLA